MRFIFICKIQQLNLLKIKKITLNLTIMNDQNFQQQQTPPPNYLVFAILVTIFCCQILGIVSIVFAAQVNSKWNSGDIQGALDASKNAKLWAWIAFGSGLIIGLVVMLLAVFGVLAGIMGGMNF
jgi:hypothetical protein